MKSIDLSQEDHRLVAILRALGNPARYFIFQEIYRQGTRSGTSLLAELPIAQSTLSEHLRRLREAQLITGEVNGAAVIYRVNQDTLNWYRARLDAQWHEPPLTAAAQS